MTPTPVPQREALALYATRLKRLSSSEWKALHTVSDSLKDTIRQRCRDANIAQRNVIDHLLAQTLYWSVSFGGNLPAGSVARLRPYFVTTGTSRPITSALRQLQQDDLIRKADDRGWYWTIGDDQYL